MNCILLHTDLQSRYRFVDRRIGGRAQIALLSQNLDWLFRRALRITEWILGTLGRNRGDMMRLWRWIAVTWMALAGGVALAGDDDAAAGLVVVELFTSQGCSSCPPADAFLHDLAGRDGVLALSLHVDYWDYIGWKDVFGQEKFSRRQKSYARVAGRRSVYTPQMVIQGQDHVVGNHPMDVTDLIARHGAQDREDVTLRISREDGEVVIRGAARVAEPMLVQLVQYSPREEVKIKKGENAGNRYVYANVARHWTRLGEWDGKSGLEMRAPLEQGLKAAVIVQRMEGHGIGPIAAAARVD